MSNLDEGVCPLTKVLPKEIGDSVLRDNVVYMSTRSNHCSASWQEGYDRRFALIIQWGHGNDRLASPIGGNGGTAEEVDYTADTYNNKLQKANPTNPCDVMKNVNTIEYQ